MNKFYLALVVILLITLSSCKKEIVHTYLMVKINTHIEDETFKKPEISIEGGGNHANDSLAVAAWRQRYKSDRQFLYKTLDKAIDAHNNVANLENTARLEATYNLLGYEYYLVALTYDKDLTQNDITNALKKYGLSSPELNKFMEEHHISMTVYNIP